MGGDARPQGESRGSTNVHLMLPDCQQADQLPRSPESCLPTMTDYVFKLSPNKRVLPYAPLFRYLVKATRKVKTTLG